MQDCKKLKRKKTKNSLVEAVLPKALKRILERRSILAAVVAFTVAMLLVDFALVFFFGPQFRSYAGYIFGRNDKETLIVLFFIEGGVIFGAGALYASGFEENRVMNPNNPAVSYVLDKIWRQRQEHREKQNALGCILMLVGGPLLLISFILCFI
jgi:hypothetical protein